MHCFYFDALHKYTHAYIFICQQMNISTTKNKHTHTRDWRIGTYRRPTQDLASSACYCRVTARRATSIEIYGRLWLSYWKQNLQSKRLSPSEVLRFQDSWNYKPRISQYLGNGARQRRSCNGRLMRNRMWPYQMASLPVTYCDLESHFCCVHFIDVFLRGHISTDVARRASSCAVAELLVPIYCNAHISKRCHHIY